MPLTANGLVKLIEECGELQQIAAKKLAYFDTDEHPDGKGSMQQRLQEEIADTYAAMLTVVDLHGLDMMAIIQRSKEKKMLFLKWHKEVATTAHPAQAGATEADDASL